MGLGLGLTLGGIGGAVAGPPGAFVGGIIGLLLNKRPAPSVVFVAADDAAPESSASGGGGDGGAGSGPVMPGASPMVPPTTETFPTTTGVVAEPPDRYAGLSCDQLAAERKTLLASGLLAAAQAVESRMVSMQCIADGVKTLPQQPIDDMKSDAVASAAPPVMPEPTLSTGIRKTVDFRRPSLGPVKPVPTTSKTPSSYAQPSPRFYDPVRASGAESDAPRGTAPTDPCTELAAYIKALEARGAMEEAQAARSKYASMNCGAADAKAAAARDGSTKAAVIAAPELSAGVRSTAQIAPPAMPTPSVASAGVRTSVMRQNVIPAGIPQPVAKSLSPHAALPAMSSPAASTAKSVLGSKGLRGWS